ncbi:MAG: glycosyltransferase family 4 protein [Thermomicrobiales bacterium]
MTLEERDEPTSALAAGAGRPRLLVLTPQPPNRSRQGAAIRNWNLLVSLAERYDVDLLTFGNPGALRSPQQTAGQPGEPWRTVVTVPAPQRTIGRRLRTLVFSRQPDMADRLWSPLFVRQLALLLRRERYDIVQGEGIELARYLHLIARARPAEARPLIVFDDHNAEYVLQQRAALTDLRTARTWFKSLYSLIQWRRLRRFERETMRLVNLTACVSEADAAALQLLAPGRPLIVAPNGVDTTYYARDAIPWDQDRDLPRFDVLFSGTLDYRPNVDAVEWFVGAVWPLLLHQQPGRPRRLALVGRNPVSEITRLVLRPGITVTGSVADDRPYFAGATVYVLPMRYGGGVRLKLLNALAMGCAVVSTTAGAEGMAVRDGEHLLIADTASDFAAAVNRLLGDAALRAQLGAAGRAFVQQHFAWASIVARLEAGYEAAFAIRSSPPATAPLAPPPDSPAPEPVPDPPPVVETEAR